MSTFFPPSWYRVRKRRTTPFQFSDGGRAETNPSERKDCTVRALAISAGISYSDAHTIMDLAGRKPKDGAHAGQIDKALRYLTELEPFTVKMVYDGLESYASINGWNRIRWNRISLAQLRKRLGPGRYYCISRRHAFAMIDGLVHDTQANGPNTLILAAWRIERTTKLELKENFDLTTPW